MGCRPPWPTLQVATTLICQLPFQFGLTLLQILLDLCVQCRDLYIVDNLNILAECFADYMSCTSTTNAVQ